MRGLSGAKLREISDLDTTVAGKIGAPFMPLVPLPAEGGGWHFVEPSSVVAVRPTGRTCEIILAGGISLSGAEESHVINKRIEDFVKFQAARR
jgi:hypothetical protein